MSNAINICIYPTLMLLLIQLLAWALIIVGGSIYIFPYLPHIKFRANRNRKRVNKIICKSMLSPIRVYYGSQTGTSEGFAKTLVDECNSIGIAAKLVDMNDFIEQFTG